MYYETGQLSAIATQFIPEVTIFLFKVAESMLEPSLRSLVYRRALRHSWGLGDDVIVPQTMAATTLRCYRVVLNGAAFLTLAWFAFYRRSSRRRNAIMLACAGSALAVSTLSMAQVMGWPHSQGEPSDVYDADDSTSSLNIAHHEVNYRMLFSKTASAMYGEEDACYRWWFWLLMASSLLRGVTGKSAMVCMALYSHVADTSSRQDRTSRFGRLLAMNLLGYFAGSFVAGTLMSLSPGFGTVFATIGGVYSVAFVAVMLCFRDVDPVDEGEGQPLDEKAADFVESDVDDEGHPITSNVSLGLVVLLVSLGYMQATKAGESDVISLLVSSPPLNWSAATLAYLMSVEYLTLGTAVLVVLPWLVGWMRSDLTVVAIGVGFKVLKLLAYSLCTDTWQYFAVLPFTSPAAFIVSGLKSAISKMTTPGRQTTAVFSTCACVEIASTALGSVAMTMLYTSTITSTYSQLYVSPAAVVFAAEITGFAVMLTILAVVALRYKDHRLIINR